jgi:DNA-binding SARP family transcriptional activator
MSRQRHSKTASGHEALLDSRARLAREDLSTLTGLDKAYEAFRVARNQAGQLLSAAYAVQAIAAAYADFRDARLWVARLRDARPAAAMLTTLEQLVVCGAIISATVIVDTTGFDSPAIAAALEQALQLVARAFGADASNDVVAVARALLEYCEQQNQPDTFRRIVDATEPYCASASLGPLTVGRYHIYHARCRFRLAAYDPGAPQDIESNALLARAEALGASAGLPHLQFDARYARVLFAAIRNDTASMAPLVEQMQDVLDYTRPNCVALYYQHLSRVHLMHDRVAQAFEAAKHALRAAELAQCVSGERRSYEVMHALALLASGESARAITEIDAMLSGVSGRPRAILECTMRFAQAWRARETGSPEYRDALNRAMQQAQELNWPLFLNSLPRIAAQLVGDALQYDCGVELARRAIALRKLAPPPDSDDRWPWELRIYTLGRFEVLIDGQPLQSMGKTQRKPLELLKLALAGGARGVDTHAITEEVWPDLEGDASRNAFDLALHRLRKLLRIENAIGIHEGRLVVDARQAWVDAWAFEVACSQTENVKASGAKEPGANALAARLLRYYAGHFLVGDDTHSVLSMRERLRSKLLRAVVALGQVLERQGDLDEAVRLYRHAIEVDPLAEEFHRRLMLCYRAQDRIAEALDAYRRCRDLISITLGVELSAATQAVYRSLKQV